MSQSAWADRSIGLVGTYPPTRCGIATFTASLAGALGRAARRARVDVVSCVDAPGTRRYPPEVVAELVSGSRRSRDAVAELLDGLDVVIVQHEFGIFGGEDGSEVVDLVSELSVPVIVVLHTALRRPSDSQRSIIDALADNAAAIVVQSASARACVVRAHELDPARVELIPHGAHADLSSPPSARTSPAPPTVLTWGLIGPGKGIEAGIEAMAALRDLEPAPRYLVLGQTHPKILESHGERYRDGLVALASELGVGHLVEFDNSYHDTAAVLARVREADVVLLPYRSRDQVVSGVLVEAIAAGTPVVATPFPHARDLASTGAVQLVPYDDPEGIADALRSLFTDAQLARQAAAAARAQAPSLSWNSVARSYLRLAGTVGSVEARAAV